MRLMHFSNAPTINVKSRPFQQDGSKPAGFWVSDESDGSHGWSSWCRAEDYGIGSNAFEVELADDANVLTISTSAALLDFHEEYAVREYNSPLFSYYVDWRTVAKLWQGILITPYQWQLRLSDLRWYYSWDCASGCIWDAAAIKSVTLVGETRMAVSS